MTNNNPTNLEIIKQACVRANPSIAEDPTSLCATGGKQCYEGCTDHYREITLADVLLAISKCKKNWHDEFWGVVDLDLEENSHMAKLSANENGYGYWDLTKLLESQSEKTLNFLAQLLHE